MHQQLQVLSTMEERAKFADELSEEITVEGLFHGPSDLSDIDEEASKVQHRYFSPVII